MARRSSVIRVSVIGDATQLQQAFRSAEQSAQSFGQNMSRLGDNLTRSVTLPLAAGFAAAFKASEEQAKAEAKLNQVLKSTGGIAGITADHVKDLAASLQQTTTYGDEATITGANLLLTFKNLRNEAGDGNDVFDRTTKLMLDMSTAMDMDMKSAAIQLGKALNDPATGLSMLTRVGVTFTDEQENLIKSLQASGDLMGAQKIILEELESQFGGTAAAVAETAGGQLTQAFNALGDAAEVIGESVAPIVIEVADGIKRAAESFQELPESLQEGIVKFGLLLAAAGPVLSIVGRLITAYKNLRTAIIGAQAVGGVAGVAGAAGAGASAGGTIAAVRASATYGAANTLGGAALTTGGVIIANNVGQDVGRGIAGALGDPFNTAGRRAAAAEAGYEDGIFFTGEVKKLWADVARNVWGFLNGSDDAAKDAAKAVKDHSWEVNESARFARIAAEAQEDLNAQVFDFAAYLEDAAGAQREFNSAASYFNEDGTLNAARLLGDLGVAASSSVDGLLRLKAAIEALNPGAAERTGAPILEPGSDAPTFGNVKPLASGGRFSAGEMLMVGEVGPELVQFDSGGTVIPNNQLRGGATVYNTFNLYGLTTGDQIRKIKEEIDRYAGAVA